jgi:GT2 family glycosyltransferase
MSKSAIAVLTYNRVQALHTTLLGLTKFCRISETPPAIAVFDDCGQHDDTEGYLTKGRLCVESPLAKELEAEEWQGQNGPTIFLGTRNLGVAGNSNRCIKWFESLGPEYTHLCILNDDLHILGDFVSFYAKAHRDLGVGLFCFCDFTSETYRWATQRYRGYSVKVLPRMTGIMMSMTRELIDRVGYFDPRFGKFGEEHCDFTIRARISGFVSIEGRALNCLDVDHQLLRHQEVETSVQGAEREAANAEAASIMSEMSQEYKFRDTYRGFCLDTPKLCGGRDGAGIPAVFLQNYATVSGRPRAMVS